MSRVSRSIEISQVRVRLQQSCNTATTHPQVVYCFASCAWFLSEWLAGHVVPTARHVRIIILLKYLMSQTKCEEMP